MKRTASLILTLLLFAATTNAQSVVVEGVIKDSQNKELLAYANVYLQQSYLGTISNKNGEFKLIIPEEKRNDSLLVSFIGYKSQVFDVSSIRNHLDIYLEKDQTTMKEVVVKGYTAEAIVKKALEKIPDNYYVEPYKSSGFYRVTSQQGSNYIHLSEAVFDLYQSKNSKPQEQFRLEKMRAIKDENAAKGLDFGLKPSSIFGLDIVNNIGEFELLSKIGLKRHTFTLQNMELVNGRPAYKITFDQKDVRKSGHMGYLLIDKETFAFLYFNFGLSPDGIEYHKYGDASLRAMLKIAGLQITMSRNDFQILYQRHGDKYYLSNVGNDATLSFQSEREKYNFTADTRVDYLLTKIEVDNISAFTKQEILGQGKLIEGQNSSYGSEFWNDYTIVLPTSNFMEIAKSIEKSNRDRKQ